MNEIMAPAFPLPDPNTAPAVTKKCTALKKIAQKPNVKAIFAPFDAERFLARVAMMMLDKPKANSTKPTTLAGAMPRT